MSKQKSFIKFYKAERKDKIPGGIADKKQVSDFDAEQLAAGTKVEMEHTNDKSVAQEIAMDHLSEDKNYYKKLKQVEKSHDYRDQFVSIDENAQAIAENNTPPELLGYMRSCMYKGPTSAETVESERHQGIYKIPFMKGLLTLAQKADNLYNGDFADIHGQVVEKVSDMTLEMIARQLVVKGFIEKADYQPAIAQTPPPVNPAPVVIQAASDQPSSIRIKLGDFEFEMRKSIKDFVSDFKKSRTHNPELIKKAIKSWRRNTQYQQFTNDTEAAKFVLENWEQEKERFNQILFAVQQNLK
jgi:hypothetical protein